MDKEQLIDEENERWMRLLSYRYLNPSKGCPTANGRDLEIYEMICRHGAPK